MSKKIAFEELEQWYSSELKRKDKIIEELKKENLTLIKIALKRSDRNVDLVNALKKKYLETSFKK